MVYVLMNVYQTQYYIEEGSDGVCMCNVCMSVGDQTIVLKGGVSVCVCVCSVCVVCTYTDTTLH